MENNKEKVQLNYVIFGVSIVLVLVGLIWPFTIASDAKFSDKHVTYMTTYLLYVLPFFGLYNIAIANVYIKDMPKQRKRILIVSTLMILMPFYLVIFAYLKTL